MSEKLRIAFLKEQGWHKRGEMWIKPGLDNKECDEGAAVMAEATAIIGEICGVVGTMGDSCVRGVIECGQELYKRKRDGARAPEAPKDAP